MGVNTAVIFGTVPKVTTLFMVQDPALQML